MDIKVFIEFIQSNPAVYFIIGVVLGYCLRAYRSDFSRKKTSRYQTKTVDFSNRSIATEVEEPPFDWTVAAATVQTVTASRVGSISLNQTTK